MIERGREARGSSGFSLLFKFDFFICANPLDLSDPCSIFGCGLAAL
jgi:hypothetical protein